jgi:hypothetical protein
MQETLDKYKKEEEAKNEKRQPYDLGTEYQMNNQRTLDLTHAEFTLVNWYYGLYGD